MYTVMEHRVFLCTVKGMSLQAGFEPALQPAALPLRHQRPLAEVRTALLFNCEGKRAGNFKLGGRQYGIAQTQESLNRTKQTKTPEKGEQGATNKASFSFSLV